MFQPATQATRPSRPARWTLSGSMCPALGRLGGRPAAFCQGIRCFGTRAIPARTRHCCLRQQDFHTQRTPVPTFCPGTLTCLAGMYRRPERKVRTYRTAVMGVKSTLAAHLNLFISPCRQSTSSPFDKGHLYCKPGLSFF